MRRSTILLVLLVALPLLVACGDDSDRPEAAPTWKHCRIDGVAHAGGLARYRDDLLFVSGDNERGVRAVPVQDLAHEGRVRARTLNLETNAAAYLMGADPLATQDYRLSHLWPLRMEFQGIAVQPPDFVYVADRVRRVVYWGRLTPDAAGRAQHVRIQGCLTVAGAQRTETASGDWRDKGPGLAGLAAVGEASKTEDLYTVDHLPGEAGRLLIRRLNRYGSPLGVTEIDAGRASAARFTGLARRKGGFALLHSQGDGFAISTVRDPRRAEAVALVAHAALPEIPGVSAWAGIAEDPDGTLYVVSRGEITVVAWLAPRAD